MELTKNHKIAIGVVVVILLAVGGYFLYKRMKKEGFDSTNPLTSSVDNQNYNDIGLMAGGGGDSYATLSASQPGSVSNLSTQGYMTPSE